MITQGEIVAGLHYVAMLEANQRMDVELEEAKNKQGIFNKYMHTIPGRSKPDWVGDPFDFSERTDFDSLYTSAAIGIGMCMYERLEQFKARHLAFPASVEIRRIPS